MLKRFFYVPLIIVLIFTASGTLAKTNIELSFIPDDLRTTPPPPPEDTDSDSSENQNEGDESQEVKVLDVTDGDTIKVEIEGKTERVRLIGVDAPEIARDEMPAECFGDESKDKMTALVLDKKVRLEKDEQNEDRDKYERLLRYVYLGNGTLVNSTIIKEGFATVLTGYPFGKINEFSQREKEAKEEKKGLHADDACLLEGEAEEAEEEMEMIMEEQIEGEFLDQTFEEEMPEPREEVNKFTPMFYTALILLIIVGILIIIVALYPKKKKKKE